MKRKTCQTYVGVELLFSKDFQHFEEFDWLTASLNQAAGPPHGGWEFGSGHSAIGLYTPAEAVKALGTKGQTVNSGYGPIKIIDTVERPADQS